ncbi:MAG TPA: SDR family oxidoreductase [Candidatus Dormibacteraeota bacterium]
MSSDRLILVTGGTGGLGRRVVPRLHGAGRRVRVLSRHPKPTVEGVEYVAADLARDSGVAEAVAGAEIVLHLAGAAGIDENEAQIRNLVRHAVEAGVRHLVNISVVGADRIPVVSSVDRAMFGYFAGQLAVERAVIESGLPWTNLRATQFHDGFVLVMVQSMTKLPVVPVPAGFRFQPVAAEEVADRLVELTLGPPAGQVPDIAGPEILDAAYLVRSYVAAVGKRRLLVPMPLPGAAARAVRDGANLAPGRTVGKQSWENFLRGYAASLGARTRAAAPAARRSPPS